MARTLRVGYVPEHFLTPLLLAHKHGLFRNSHPPSASGGSGGEKLELELELVPQPSGTGQMIQSFRDGAVDVCIGLTEGWINGLAKLRAEAASAASVSTAGAGSGSGAGNVTNTGTATATGTGKQVQGMYKLIGTYVTSPLCWAISTGLSRELKSADELRGGRVGVSRIGSGSYVMAFVLADQKGWLSGASHASAAASDSNGSTAADSAAATATDTATADGAKTPFDFVKLDTFANLRRGVNDVPGRPAVADAFMWEYFTTKKYYAADADAAVRQIGEIYTPWPSWCITASQSLLDSAEGAAAVADFLKGLDAGVAYYGKHKDEAMSYIAENLDYSRADAEAWAETVTFATTTVARVDPAMVDAAITTLRKAGLMTEDPDATAADLIAQVGRSGTA